jgi:hypothetical protein
MNDQPFRHDPRNKFEVANANRAAELKRSADRAAVRRNTAVAASDAKSGRPKTASGVLLDTKTAEAKRRRDDDLAAGRSATSTPPPLPLSPATMEAVTASWLQLTPDFYNSEFNRTSMRNWVRMNVERNGAVFGIELLDTAFRWLTENNYLEKAPSTVRKRGEVVTAAAPEIFPYDAAEEISARRELARQVAESVDDGEAERARNLPFEQLEREVKAGRKVQTRQQAEGVLGAIR